MSKASFFNKVEGCITKVLNNNLTKAPSSSYTIDHIIFLDEYGLHIEGNENW